MSLRRSPSHCFVDLSHIALCFSSTFVSLIKTTEERSGRCSVVMGDIVIPVDPGGLLGGITWGPWRVEKGQATCQGLLLWMAVQGAYLFLPGACNPGWFLRGSVEPKHPCRVVQISVPMSNDSRRLNPAP